MPEAVQPDMPPAARFHTLDKWLAWQEKLHFTAIELGLDRCRKVAENMGLLPPAYFVISVAGTNGKGSSAVMLENILRSAGYKVGLYTSPHLLAYNERIRIEGLEAGDARLCESFGKIDAARGNVSLTYFEFGTLAAMDIFQRHSVDIAVMEVGMGGRLDAVNMLDANVSLVSTIDIDHERWLGPDRNTIGREKAGIYRSMRPAICADPDPPPSIMETANLVGANLLRSGHEFSHEASGEGWSWRSGLTRYDRLPVPSNQACQIRNASGVLMVLESISDRYPVPRELVYAALKGFSMPGRFQVIPGEVTFILDVAHNRQAASELAGNLAALPGTGRTLAVLGMLKDKDQSGFFQEVHPFVDAWYLATLDDPRGAASGDLAAVLDATASGADRREFDGLETALCRARAEARPGDRILVTGSFVTVGGAMKLLGIKV